MSRLNLDAFKAQVNENQTNELEALSGGILGACHCTDKNCGDAQYAFDHPFAAAWHTIFECPDNNNE